MFTSKPSLTMATEAITQRSFARRKGIYMREMFTSPPMHNIEGMELPLGSVVHYLPEEDKDHAPDESWWLIRGQPKETQIWVEHMTEFTLFHGKAKRLPGDPSNWARKWHMKQPRLKRVINRKTALAMPTNLLVINHALARNWYDYHNNRFLRYQISKNTRDNAINEIARAVEEIDRAHFIPVKMPSKLYELTKVKKAASEGDLLQVESIKRFGSVEGLFFLEIWRFIANPEDSILSRIKKEFWSRVNLMLTCNGSWFMVNLADLASWVKTESNPEGKWDPEKAQRIFLSNLVQLVENALVAEKKQNDELSSVTQDETSPGDALSTIKESSSNSLGTIALKKTSQDQSSELLEPVEDGISETAPEISPLLTKGRNQKSEEQSKRYSVDSRKQPEVSSKGAKTITEDSSIEVVKTLTDEEIDSNLESLEKVDALIEAPEFEAQNPNANPLEEGILSRARKLARDGLISAAALKQSEKLAVAYKQIKNPFGDGLAYEASRVTPEERQVEAKKIPTRSKRVFDESLKVSSIEDVTTKYVRETYKKDVVNVLLSTQRSGVAITDIEVDTVENMSGSQLIVLARTSALTGRSTTLPIILPNFEKDGTYVSGGTRYRMRTQRVDAPIRLVRPGLVYLTSYYGKISVSRSDKVVHDYDRWLTNKIAAMEIDGTPLIKASEHGNVFDQSLHTPKTFSILSRRFKSIQLANYMLMFDRREIDKAFSEKERQAAQEHQGWVICGIDLNNKPVMMNESGEVFVGKVNQGRIEDIFGIDTSEAPHPAAMIRVRGNALPLGVVMASYIGLTNMINHLGNKVRRVQSGNRMHLEKYETPIRFADESLIVDTRDAKTTMLLMGFKHYAKQIRQLSVYGFDKSHSYQFLFDSANRSSANSVELELLDEQFIDPMTERVLIDMKEPTTWQGLLWRSLELLLTDYSPEEMDGKMMTFKLHERINGMLYNELVKSIRRYKMDSRIGKAGVDMKPTAVWQKIATDAAISPVNDCNPVADLRAQEGVTYIGHGGRSKRSMVARNRKYHGNDMGIIAMDTVDSGDTGISIYFTANPNVVNTSGVSEKGSAETTGVSSMVSTSSLLGPCLDIDDPRRVAFSSIQFGSGRAAKGYRTMPLGTGYEEVLAGRVSNKFAYVAKGPGKVLSLKNDVLKVQYASGQIDSVEVGRVFTGGEGHTYPNNIVVTVKADETFNEGDTLAFNEAWFEQSFHDPKLVSFKHGVPTTVMLCENINTLEDGSVISPDLGAALTAEETEIRELVFPFKFTIHDLVKVGDKLEPDDILCVIEDESTAAAGLFGEDTVKTLNLLADNSPKAKVHGTVDRIEILYNGDIEDMSESMRKLTEESDKRIRLKMRDLGKNIEDGRTDEAQRVGGQPLQVDTLVIKIYISHASKAGAGDKAVMGNQLKTVHGQVMVDKIITESGREIQFQYADVGVENRVVRSPRKWGIMNLMLVRMGERLVEAYRGK